MWHVYTLQAEPNERSSWIYAYVGTEPVGATRPGEAETPRRQQR